MSQHLKPRKHRSQSKLLTERDRVVLLPFHLLLLHNFSNLFVTETVGVIVGTSLQQLLLGLLFLAVLQNSTYFRDPNLLRQERLRILSPGLQVCAYLGVWGLLVIYDCLLAMLAERRLLRATRRLVESMQDRVVQRHLMLRSPTVLSEVDEPVSEYSTPRSSRASSKSSTSEHSEGVPLDLSEEEEESLLNPVRKELLESISKMEEEKEKGILKHSNSLVESLQEDSRLLMEFDFMRYVLWQVISHAFISIPTWAVPDVVSAIYIWLTAVWIRYGLRPGLKPITMASGSLIISTFVIVFINRSIIRQELQRGAREEEEGEKEEDEYWDPKHHHHYHHGLENVPHPDEPSTTSTVLSRRGSKRSTQSAFLSMLPDVGDQLMSFSNFAAENVLSSLGFAVGISFEILLDYVGEDFVAASYTLEVLNSFLTIVIAAYIQWKFLDTSFESSVSADFITNVKRFLSTSLTFLVAWSIKYVVVDTKALILRQVASYYGTGPEQGSSGNQTVPVSLLEGVAVKSKFAFLSPFSGEGRVTDYTQLSVTGEFFVAVICMFVLGCLVGLLTWWQNNAIRRSLRRRYRKHFIQLVILACGTVIGWCWSSFFGVVYKQVVSTWAPPDRPWLSAFCLIFFVIVVLQFCCFFSTILIFYEEKAKDKWRAKIRNRTGSRSSRDAHTE